MLMTGITKFNLPQLNDKKFYFSDVVVSLPFSLSLKNQINLRKILQNSFGERKYNWKHRDIHEKLCFKFALALKNHRTKKKRGALTRHSFKTLI